MNTCGSLTDSRRAAAAGNLGDLSHSVIGLFTNTNAADFLSNVKPAVSFLNGYHEHEIDIVNHM